MQVIRGLGAGCIACLVMASGARADDDWSSTRDSFICKSSTEVREIKTYISNAQPGESEKGLVCRVDYVRNGSTQTLWSSRTSRSYCDGKAVSLVAKLQAGIFACKPLHLE